MITTNNALVSVPSTPRTEGVVTHFQPILSARRRSMIGLEALSRGAFPHADGMAAGALFKMAKDAGIADEVERQCKQEAVRRFATLTHRSADLVLFLNLG